MMTTEFLDDYGVLPQSLFGDATSVPNHQLQISTLEELDVLALDEFLESKKDKDGEFVASPLPAETQTLIATGVQTNKMLDHQINDAAPVTLMNMQNSTEIVESLQQEQKNDMSMANMQPSFAQEHVVMDFQYNQNNHGQQFFAVQQEAGSTYYVTAGQLEPETSPNVQQPVVMATGQALKLEEIQQVPCISMPVIAQKPAPTVKHEAKEARKNKIKDPNNVMLKAKIEEMESKKKRYGLTKKEEGDLHRLRNNLSCRESRESKNSKVKKTEIDLTSTKTELKREREAKELLTKRVNDMSKRIQKLEGIIQGVVNYPNTPEEIKDFLIKETNA